MKLVIADPECDKNVICIIDGLGECEDVVPFINAIARLYSERETHATKGGLLKIIATTRVTLEPSSAGMKRLKQTTMKSIMLSPEQAHSMYIRTRVGNMKKPFSENVRAKLIRDLTGTVGWTFLFISLVLDLLENFAVDDDGALQCLDLSITANTLDDVYQTSLSRCLQQSSRKTMHRLLGIFCAATEPLTLNEINVAIKVKCGNEANDAIITAENLKSLCGVLLRVVGSKVIFVHQTARDFLIKSDQEEAVNSEQWKHTLSPLDSNKLLADICVSFLLRQGFGNDPLEIPSDDGYLLIEQKIKEYTAKYPFLEYAAKHWAEHFSFPAVERSDQQLVDSVIKLCDTSSNAFRTWFQVYWTRASPPFLPPRSITSIMVDCHFGHSYVLGQRKKKSFTDIKLADERGYTALHWAAQSGKSEIVEIILDLGPDLDAKTKEKRTALDLAAGRGYEKVVQLIYSRILDRTDQNSPNATNIRSKGSSTSTNTSMVQKEPLQNRRKSLSPMGIDGVRTLMLIEAAQDGNETLVNSLLDQGTNSNQTNDDGSTALHLAASKNHLSIVRLLIEKGRAGIDRRNKDGETALALASAKGYKAVVELLLYRGANTQGVNLDGNTLVSRADESVKGLLERPPIVRGPSVVPRARSPPPLIPYSGQTKEKSHPSHDFRATVLDLWFPDTQEQDFHEERSQFANPTVHNLLYGDGPNLIMSPLQGYMPKTPTFRWLHLPANNVSISQVHFHNE